MGATAMNPPEPVCEECWGVAIMAASATRKPVVDHYVCTCPISGNGTVYGLDPGLRESALVGFRVNPKDPCSLVPVWKHYGSNESVLDEMYALSRKGCRATLCIEVMKTIFVRRGKGSAGRDQIVTERWGGRFIEAFRGPIHHGKNYGAREVREVNRSFARSVVGGKDDSEVRRAIIDMYGGKEAAFGKKCKGHRKKDCPRCDPDHPGWEVPPGPLHGWTGSHLFAATAVALAAHHPRYEATP